MSNFNDDFCKRYNVEHNKSPLHKSLYAILLDLIMLRDKVSNDGGNGADLRIMGKYDGLHISGDYLQRMKRECCWRNNDPYADKCNNNIDEVQMDTEFIKRFISMHTDDFIICIRQDFEQLVKAESERNKWFEKDNEDMYKSLCKETSRNNRLTAETRRLKAERTKAEKTQTVT